MPEPHDCLRGAQTLREPTRGLTLPQNLPDAGLGHASASRNPFWITDFRLFAGYPRPDRANHSYGVCD